MKILLDSLNRVKAEKLLKEGTLAKIEIHATTGDGFAERLAKFLHEVGNYTSGGASRTIGVLDASDDKERELKLHIDGDGADRMRDITLNGVALD